MDGCPLGLGLVMEDKPTEFSCTLQVHVQSTIHEQKFAAFVETFTM